MDDASFTPIPPVLPPARSIVSRLFFDDERRLRSGWRFLVFVVLYAFALLVIGLLLRPLARRMHNIDGPWRVILQELLLLAAVFVATGVMALYERRGFGAYGLPALGAFGARFWEGIVWGFVALSLLLVGIFVLHGYSFGPVATHGATAWKYGLLWALAFTGVALAEEFTFRGYALRTLGDALGFWPAAILLSIGFGAVHLPNPGETAFGAAMAGAVGLVFCISVWQTGSLWFAIGAHLGWDWAETYFYGVPDSGMIAPGHLLQPSFHGPNWLTGGSVGPEASRLVPVVLLIMAVLLFARFRHDARAPWPQ